MKPLRLIGVLVVVAACLLAPAGARGAQPCPAGCGFQKKACLQTARVANRACRQGCRASSSRADQRTCARGCTDQLRTAKTACGGDHTDCLGSCSPTPPPGSCTGAFLDGCGQTLAACARGVVARATTCVRGCGTAADRLACLQACAATAQQGAAMCATDFEGCVAGCSCRAGCDDGNPCTRDTCLDGTCVHECLCVGPMGEPTCCPGPGVCPVPTTTTTAVTTTVVPTTTTTTTTRPDVTCSPVGATCGSCGSGFCFSPVAGATSGVCVDVANSSGTPCGIDPPIPCPPGEGCLVVQFSPAMFVCARPCP
jgi:hypothetical protein